MSRDRLRNLGMTIGQMPTGALNAITDVPGVQVGQETVIADEPRTARTGVTVIMPHSGTVWHEPVFAGYHSFNGSGEMTGLLWLEEGGVLNSPIAITNTHSIGAVHQALIAYCMEQDNPPDWLLPIVAETYDGWLNDINAFHITADHVYAALNSTTTGRVAEGNVGGGTGMICHEFKGGIGTSSRLATTPSGTYTVGVLVQANYGKRSRLRLNGIAVGQTLTFDRVPSPWQEPPSGGSIIVVIATDAPLLPMQCKRLARRATAGLANTGGIGHHTSGDIFLAFSTSNVAPFDSQSPHEMRMLPHEQIDPLFEAVVEATEESIWNALTSAETMTGLQGHTAYAIPLEELQQLFL